MTFNLVKSEDFYKRHLDLLKEKHLDLLKEKDD